MLLTRVLGRRSRQTRLAGSVQSSPSLAFCKHFADKKSRDLAPFKGLMVECSVLLKWQVWCLPSLASSGWLAGWLVGFKSNLSFFRCLLACRPHDHHLCQHTLHSCPSSKLNLKRIEFEANGKQPSQSEWPFDQFPPFVWPRLALNCSQTLFSNGSRSLESGTCSTPKHRTLIWPVKSSPNTFWEKWMQTILTHLHLSPADLTSCCLFFSAQAHLLDRKWVEYPSVYQVNAGLAASCVLYLSKAMSAIT